MLPFDKLYLHTNKLSLLLVEDYEPLRSNMQEILQDLFQVVYCSANGKDALDIYENYYKFNHKYIDIIIADIQMPVMNGVELSKKIKEMRPEQSIIILSAHTDSKYLLELINYGIAQFITKPIENDNLMDTLYKVSKNISTHKDLQDESSTLKLGENYIWDKNRLMLTKDSVNVELTKHELLLLELLIKKQDQLCTNSEISQEFYNNDIDISEKNIRNLIFKLRKKLPKKSINSIYGMGYRFITHPYLSS